MLDPNYIIKSSEQIGQNINSRRSERMPKEVLSAKSAVGKENMQDVKSVSQSQRVAKPIDTPKITKNLSNPTSGQTR